MSGEPDPLYVQARRVLLDATDALAEQLDAIVLVGAQAIYLHTGAANPAVAEYTTDADFSIGPSDLTDSPLLAELMTSGGFVLDEHPGSVAQPGRHHCRPHGPRSTCWSRFERRSARDTRKSAARRAKGLEGALVDRDHMTISALDPADHRSVSMFVAGVPLPIHETY